jgi:hypothetical protein
MTHRLRHGEWIRGVQVLLKGSTELTSEEVTMARDRAVVREALVPSNGGHRPSDSSLL